MLLSRPGEASPKRPCCGRKRRRIHRTRSATTRSAPARLRPTYQSARANYTRYTGSITVITSLPTTLPVVAWPHRHVHLYDAHCLLRHMPDVKSMHLLPDFHSTSSSSGLFLQVILMLEVHNRVAMKPRITIGSMLALSAFSICCAQTINFDQAKIACRCANRRRLNRHSLSDPDRRQWRVRGPRRQHESKGDFRKGRHRIWSLVFRLRNPKSYSTK